VDEKLGEMSYFGFKHSIDSDYEDLVLKVDSQNVIIIIIKYYNIFWVKLFWI